MWGVIVIAGSARPAHDPNLLTLLHFFPHANHNRLQVCKGLIHLVLASLVLIAHIELQVDTPPVSTLSPAFGDRPCVPSPHLSVLNYVIDPDRLTGGRILRLQD